MSDIEIPAGGEADEISPDEGVADTEAEPVEAVEAEPQYDFLEVDDDLASKYVRAKVDGEEIPVQFNDLINSYSRESVSTQRFQEASALRQEAENAVRLQQALQVNPGLTIQFLAQQAGTTVEEYLGMTPQQRQDAVETVEEDEYADPLERKLLAQQQQVAQVVERLEQREADERLASAVNQLKGTYQIDDNAARAVVGQALQMGVGPEAFPMIYESMAFRASQQARAQHTAQQEAEIQKRQASAAKAQQTIGTSPSVVGTTSEVTGNFTSIRDAAAAALEGLGID